VQIQNRAEAVYNKLRDVVNGGVEAAEEKLGKVLDILTGSSGEDEREKKGGHKAEGEL